MGAKINKPDRAIVVLGGGFGGLTAASRLGRALPSAKVSLVTQDDTFVERVRFHQVATGQQVARYPLASLLAPANVELVQGVVTDADLAAQRIAIKSQKRACSLRYDKLVFALGSTVDCDSVQGAAEFACSLANVPAAEELARRLVALPATSKVVVCGAGLTGIELAFEIAEVFPNLRVTIVDAGAFGRAFSWAGQDHLKRALSRFRIGVLDEHEIVRVERSQLVFREHEPVTFDVCVWVASFKVSQLARASGLRVNQLGQLLIDDTLRSVSHPNVYGVGDAANFAGPVSMRVRMGCATAIPMAVFASNNIIREIRGEPLSPFRFAYAVQLVSLGRTDALAQYVHADDRPRAWVSTGLLAAYLKELTFSMNLFAIKSGFAPYEPILKAMGVPPLVTGEERK